MRSKRSWSGSEMGIKEMGLFLMFFSCHLYLPAAPSPLPSVLLQEKNFKNKEMDKNSIRGSDGGGSSIVHRHSVSHRGGAGNVEGGRSGNGENGNNGGSTSPSTAGGTAVIPIYAAGAANKNHQNNHHSGGSCNWSCLGLPTLGAAILATLALHITLVFGFAN